MWFSGDWTAEKKIQLSDFEADSRFLKMCRILSKDFQSSSIMGDLATVLGVTGDDEAAKLISSASLGQMVRILEKLSSKRKRSPPLLRSLAFNISKSDEKLNVKQCADILYAMANLSFHDEVGYSHLPPPGKNVEYFEISSKKGNKLQNCTLNLEKGNLCRYTRKIRETRTSSECRIFFFFYT